MLLTFDLRIGLLAVIIFFTCVVRGKQYGTPGNTLYVAEEQQRGLGKTFQINRFVEEESPSLERRKRDASVSSTPALEKNITTWTTHLNDSHQQLMVHWVGEGSNVIICLARDSSPKNKGGLSPSALFISYDYGKNFTNKTDSFKLSDAPNSGYAQLDKFFNHPKYPEFCVFVDSTNKKLFYTSDNGQNITRSDLDFHPSELAFDEELPNVYVILDKVDTIRRLYLTVDGGKTFKQLHNYVKSFIWTTGPGISKTFYVERWKPNGTSTVLSASDPTNFDHATVIFQDAKDFQIKGDFMFATKQSKERNTLDLYISHQKGPFYKAEFETELDMKKFHIADVTDKRIFVSVMHTEILADLYVSEISNNYTRYNFMLSMEQILCYFPDGNWKDTWLEDMTEDPFTDLYRVEGLKGIYIASRVDSKAQVAHVGPEHLISLITFDHGVNWSPINPPTEDENGKPLNCHIENSCSLHLCQKFSQLYPVTRSASIMSSKSAPGIIMATGVMGKSLKGIPGVYLSRDAGLTWKRILKDYYFFNYGDHGGVLVAVKYFKLRGETRKILYSTNEGNEWNSYQFNADDLRIYGLMTEPGENTTTFTMFGSANEQHQWIIITIDLQNAFPRNCTPDDYKFWSPSPPNSSVSCVLGTRDTFQRRLAHTNCYNGINYDRPVKKEVCECSRRDYECDVGFQLSNNACVRNKSDKHDPYATPNPCRPGTLYQRTKGYRKIDGDVCTSSTYLTYAPDMVPCPLEEPTEFILVALRDKIARIDLSDNSTLFPVKSQNNIVAIEFDLKNNCIYWADIEIDKISRQCFNNGTTQEVIVDTDLASIEGMALDWISNVLFFVDGMRKKIEAVRTDLTIAGRMRVTILDSKVLSKPRGIAVHPKAGYLFWTDWDRTNPTVSRSNLDGTNVKKLFGKPIVQWPNGITIDQMAERIYWVDAMEDYIASADIDGRYFKRILWKDEKVSHPFAVAVLKDKMYWDDWKAKSIFIADKDSGDNVITINNSFSGLMDLKVFAHFIQHGSNACSYKNTSCDTMCLGGPGKSFTCLCPNGFKMVNGKCMCANGMEPSSNMTCPTEAGATCDPDQFTCKNGMCITASWHCNGNNDCGDLSDEIGCPLCAPPMLSCDDDSRCYLPQWRCDGDVDCPDFSDERGCKKPNCTESQFQCDSGMCIYSKWMCDGDNDCHDGSDERNCTITPKRPDTVNCSLNGFACGNDTNAICIPNPWVCDGERDCPGGEDERADKCSNSTCAPYMFRCPSGKCIFKSWVCDGENDCSDHESSDELNCTSIGHSKVLPRPSTEKAIDFPTNTTCLDWMFRCQNNNCLPYWWRCDGINDCGDNSDEVGCGALIGDLSTTAPDADLPRERKCGKTQFTCSPGVCVPLSWVCDMAEDCPGGEDERNCQRRGGGARRRCGPDETPCSDGRGCVRADRLCDGRADCQDRSDEAHCAGSKTTTFCPSGYTVCGDGMLCVSQASICNGHQDCYDGSDEANCTSVNNETQGYQIQGIGVDQPSINSTSFLISFWMSQQKMVLYSFMPSICKVEHGVCQNMTWIHESVYRFTDLEPYTLYNVTFYIKDSRSNKTYASNKYVNATTGEGVPSPPLKLGVTQLTGSRISVAWDPPKTPQGQLQSYTVYYTPPIPPMEIMTRSTETNMTIKGYFKPNKNYSFWVTATNGAFTSNSSEVQTIMFDDVGDVDDLSNVSLARINESTAFLTWPKIRGIEGYKLLVRPPRPAYVEWEPIITDATNITLTNLPTGVRIYVDVMAFKGAITGQPLTIFLRPEGTQDVVINSTAYLVKEKLTSVQLSWSPPTDERYKGKELEYNVYYNEALNNKILIKKVTKSTSMLIDKLHACESYVFAVTLANGPMAKIHQIVTRENPKAPIKNLHCEFNEDKTRMEILWNANCDVVHEPVTYRLEITEETRNKISRYDLEPTENVKLSHVINNLPVGGRYNICIYSNERDAAVKCLSVRGREVPAPRNVVAWLAPNGLLMVNWDDHHTDKDPKTPKYTYQIIVSEKEIPEDTVHLPPEMKTETATNSPRLVTVPVASGTLYCAVRAVTSDGYYSDLSEVHTLEMAGEAEPQTSAVTALWWGGGAALIGGLALGGALLHLVLRNRRLTRSFLRFSYDSRRGQATIGDHDDDDVPPIHGFSDDEPLVIA
ncbi:sortilin-related receptor-like isoform X2 [Choristoneura fumiferana]|uniref:sortilin-related receptor-like isoform X2 n=1 Tax=Choristoneura fumiferana TaxID=7141 RepID=UPI003D15AD1A